MRLGAGPRFPIPRRRRTVFWGGVVLPAVCITFDDGLKEHFAAAKEVLEPRGIRGFFFVCSRPSLDGRALSVHKMHWLRAHNRAFGLCRRVPVGAARSVAGGTRSGAALRTRRPRSTSTTPPRRPCSSISSGSWCRARWWDAVGSDMLRSRGIDEREFCRELYLSDDEVRELAESGHLIGAHGHSALSGHPPRRRRTRKGIFRGRALLPRLPGDQARVVFLSLRAVLGLARGHGGVQRAVRVPLLPQPGERVVRRRRRPCTGSGASTTTSWVISSDGRKRETGRCPCRIQGVPGVSRPGVVRGSRGMPRPPDQEAQLRAGTACSA